MNFRSIVHAHKQAVLSAFLILFVFSPVYAKDLIVCDDVTDPATLDPHKQFSEKNHTLLQQIYEGLVRFDPDGKIEPALAESWQRIDPLRMRFHLRKNVSFHNGEPFDAESVKFTIERYLNPNTGFPAYGFINSLDRVEIVDPHTIDLITKFPDGLLLNRLAGFILIVPMKYVQAEGDAILLEKPNGTGPFIFNDWIKGKQIVLVKNSKYWNLGYPKIEKLIFKFIPTDEQVEMLLSGKIDLLMDVPGTRTTKIVESGKGKIVKRPSFYTFTSSMNISSGPLSDVRVRRAINMAIDRKELVRYDVFGNGKPIATMSMVGQLGHNPKLEPYAFNKEKAMELLKEAGLSKGFSLKVFVKEQAIRPFKIIRKQLESIGVELVGDIIPDGQMISQLKENKWDFTLGDCPDPMAHSFFIQAIVLYSKSPFSIMHSNEYDSKLEQMMMALDEKTQKELGESLDKYIYDNALSIFTYQRIKTYGMRKNLKFIPYETAMPYFYKCEFGSDGKVVEVYE